MILSIYRYLLYLCLNAFCIQTTGFSSVRQIKYWTFTWRSLHHTKNAYHIWNTGTMLCSDWSTRIWCECANINSFELCVLCVLNAVHYLYWSVKCSLIKSRSH
jgi:hypothetical protein